MKVLSSSAGHHFTKGSVLTIGNFDGLHLGHKKLIDTVIKRAKQYSKVSVLYTFSPHPMKVLFPKKEYKALYPLKKTIDLLQKTDLQYLVVEPFTLCFSELSPELFIEQYIVKYMHPKSIVVGHDFRFGLKGSGSIKSLKILGKKYKFDVIEIDPVKKEGITISSSIIKKNILLGHLGLVTELLGRPFSLKGVVITGEGRGKALGFPTINLQIEKDILMPANGVYTAKVVKKNQCFQSVVNIGTNPTFSKKRVRKIEVHIIGYNKVWCESECEVELLHYIRPEKKFFNSEDLIFQIKKDIEQTKKHFLQ